MTATNPSRPRPHVDVREVLARDDRRPDRPDARVVALAPVPVLVAALAIRPLVQGTAWWARDRTDATGDGSATDEHGRDGVELEAVARARRGEVELAGEEIGRAHV